MSDELGPGQKYIVLWGARGARLGYAVEVPADFKAQLERDGVAVRVDVVDGSGLAEHWQVRWAPPRRRRRA